MIPFWQQGAFDRLLSGELNENWLASSTRMWNFHESTASKALLIFNECQFCAFQFSQLVLKGTQIRCEAVPGSPNNRWNVVGKANTMKSIHTDVKWFHSLCVLSAKWEFQISTWDCKAGNSFDHECMRDAALTFKIWWALLLQFSMLSVIHETAMARGFSWAVVLEDKSLRYSRYFSILCPLFSAQFLFWIVCLKFKKTIEPMLDALKWRRR